MTLCMNRCFVLAFATLLATTSINANNDTDTNRTAKGDDRQPRVTGRIVKLYSGTKNEPIECLDEGFQGDPTNCAVFYRCIKSGLSGHGKFKIFRFECGPGTIYDPETEVCNHPKNTKRSECFDSMQRSKQIKTTADDDIDNDVRNELPSPIDLNSLAVQPITAQFLSSIAPSPPQPSRITLPPPITRVKLSPTTTRSVSPKNQQEGDTCTEDGFMGDSDNCRKFYRCVANGRGGFIRYEFSCSESTVWDDETQGCNHPWSVKRRRCGRDVGDSERPSSAPTSTPEAAQPSSADNEADASTIQEQIQINFGNKISQLQLQINNGTKVKQNQTQVNYGDKVKQNQKQENNAPNSQQSQKQTSHGSAISQSQKQVNYGDKTTQTQVQIDHTKQSSQQQQSNTYLPPDSDTKPQAAQNNEEGNDNKCSESGFMGDSNDCKKFYRCVENGKGSFTRYEFACGDGTVWDQNIEACNHAWAVKDCGGKAPSESSQTELSSTTTTTTAKPSQAAQTTPKPAYTEDVNDEPSYGNDNSPPSTENAPKPETKPETTTHGSTSNDSTCKSSGFMGDPNNCKKFYRCVDNGNGSYTKYEFSCGDGTVWDQRIEGCNHAWAVEKCGGAPTEEHEKVDTTTKKETTQSQTTQSSVTQDDDTGYGQQQEETSLSPATTAKQPQGQESSSGKECKKSGFMGDDKDCRKFYRCVDNGNGAYTRYDFSCGEGTVWDQSIEACNHAWAVKKCGGTGTQGTQSQTESVHVQDSTTTTTESSNSDIDDDQGYNQPSSEPDSTTAKSPTGSDETCKQDGFMGDRKDCKKFYRCVDNGQGGFTKYEFTCGEGTVWDQEIQGCNHPSSNKKCGGTGSSQSQTTKEPKPDNDDSYTESTEKTTTESSKTTQTPSEQRPQPSNDKCESEGFYGDSSNCKKFYRCVDDGKGGYTKYDFSCGDGTVWDQEIQGCNHDNGKCKQSSPSGTTQSAQEATTKAQDDSTTQGSGTTTTTEKTSSSQPSNDKCSSEGFYANSQDCKKFYRCVDNGKGGFTKYDFSCGEGTVWVQELQACDHDNDVNSCGQSSQNNDDSTQSTSEIPDQQQSTSATQSQTQADESPNESTSKPSSESDGTCSSEGFFPNKKDCRKFYRCVDNGHGGYTKYDFTCGEGTAWDSDIQACNHISEVKSCDGSTQGESQTESGLQDESTEGTTKTSTSGPSTESSKPSNSKDTCTDEGFYGNKDDCKKFYRCVNNGKGGYTKYDFTCGEGTIWDQDITACNHPRDVANPSCSDNESQSESSSSSSSTTEGSSQGSSSTTESSQGSSNCSDDSSKKPDKGNITCDKEGFHENPNDCKKFYRCVDWDGDGKKFSVFHFECGEGTIWDPALDTCNYEDSVYPPRDCSGSQSQSGNVDEETTTTEGTTTSTDGTTTTTTEDSTTTTEAESTTKQKTTTEESTTQSSITEQSTTEKTTTQESTTSEQTTTQQSTTSEQTTTQQSTTSEQTTTQQTTTTEGTTTEKTTTEQTTTQQTTQESTTSEQTTQSSATEGTTQESTTSEQTTTQDSITTEGTTEPTTQESTTQDSTEQSSDSTTESSTDGTTTEQSDQSTTESSDDQSTTEQSSESEKECPETEDDQYLYVCPTGFRRHPKYCDMFYQCSEDDDTHEVKIATFNCPNNTIYDDSKTQCVEEDKADKKCDGQKAQKRRFKRLDLNMKSPIVVSKQKHSCPAAGHFPFEKNEECSPAFLKCEKSKGGNLRGMVYRCPEGYVYWSVSRRCEPKSYLSNCKHSANDWSGRWEIPMERRNVAKI